jgi:predicted phosphodiesterase
MITTFRDRDSSLWQSALAEIVAQQNKGQAHLGKRFKGLTKGAQSPPSWEAIHADPMVLEATESLQAMQLRPGELATARAAIPIKKCGEIALELAWAKINHDEDAIDQLTNELNFSACDPRWAETIETYIGYFKLGKASIPYRSGGDYVLDFVLPQSATIGIVGDWGTGSSVAQDLLKQVAGYNPDLLMHLGDIYYSGTLFECQTCFLDICRAILPAQTPVVTLAGNHDMYSAGLGYYWLVDQLHQQASYFCIQNDDWQFLAMDTGYHDFDPLSVNTNVTYPTSEEIAWHLNKIQNRGKRRTALFSHHQLFSAFEPIGGKAVNDRLLDQFKTVLPNIDIWLWGHEHRLDVYKPYLGLQRGRCLGCSAVPEFVDPNYFTPKFGDVPLQPVQLANDGSTYDHAYAIMKLNGPQAEICYYQQSAPNKPLFTEQI